MQCVHKSVFEQKMKYPEVKKHFLKFWKRLWSEADYVISNVASSMGMKGKHMKRSSLFFSNVGKSLRPGCQWSSSLDKVRACLIKLDFTFNLFPPDKQRKSIKTCHFAHLYNLISFCFCVRIPPGIYFKHLMYSLSLLFTLSHLCFDFKKSPALLGFKLWPSHYKAFFFIVAESAYLYHHSTTNVFGWCVISYEMCWFYLRFLHSFCLKMLIFLQL